MKYETDISTLQNTAEHYHSFNMETIGLRHGSFVLFWELPQGLCRTLHT